MSLSTKAQDIAIKGGIGFYSIYESNILSGRDREISMNPTPIGAVAVTWHLSNLFFLSWENSFRLKSLNANHIGLDTTNSRKSIYGYSDFKFINIDSKAMGKIVLTNFTEGKIIAVVGGGVSLKISDSYNFTESNRNVVLSPADNQMPPDVLDGEWFNNSGLLTELGFEANYKKFSGSISLLMELFKTDYYDIGDNKSILTQINIMYTF